MGQFYGGTVWDPVLILAQILTLQCLFYVTLGVFLFILVGPYVPHLSLTYALSSEWVHFGTFTCWMVVLASVCTALACAVYLLFVVERAKKCLDFGATIYILHLSAVAAYSGIPMAPTWWGTMLGCMAVTAVLGEWLCLQREMRDIPVGSVGQRRRSTTSLTELVPLNAQPTQPSNNQSVSSLTGRLFERLTGKAQSLGAVSSSLPGTRSLGGGTPAKLPQEEV